MSDAMIFPCGHTFGAGGIEQVKQMVRSFIITISYFTLCLWNLFFWLCSLRRI